MITKEYVDSIMKDWNIVTSAHVGLRVTVTIGEEGSSVEIPKNKNGDDIFVCGDQECGTFSSKTFWCNSWSGLAITDYSNEVLLKDVYSSLLSGDKQRSYDLFQKYLFFTRFRFTKIVPSRNRLVIGTELTGIVRCISFHNKLFLTIDSSTIRLVRPANIL